MVQDARPRSDSRHPVFAGDVGFVMATWMAGSSPGHDGMESAR
jgi:hypothetical protein